MKGKQKKILAWLLSLAMLASVTAGVLTPVIVVKAEETTMTFNFGTNGNVTSAYAYDAAKGYGFTDISYPNAAEGWVSNIYHPRVKVTSVGASNVTDAADYLTIGSKVWTETGDALNADSATQGIFTYDNTSVFNVDLEPADYNVAVTLVNPTNTPVTVNLIAEDLTKATVDVPAQSASVVSTYMISLVDGQLNLKFEAKSSATTLDSATVGYAYVKSVGITRKATEEPGAKPTIYIASDSTVQTYDSNVYPQAGWGQELFKYFAGADSMVESATTAGYSQSRKYELPSVIIENRAIGGRSSKSFIDEGKLDNILNSIRPGDYLFVQWGHNDATYVRPNRYVSPSDFGSYLQKYIDGARQRGATCVLVTPVPRYSFTNGVCNISFPEYRQVMLDLGAQQGVPVLDLGKAGADFLTSFGEAQSKSVFLQLDPGVYPNYPSGISDATHYQEYGAIKMAQILAQLIKDNDQLAALTSLVPDIPVPDSVPSAPANLTTLSIGSSSIKFKWDSVTGAALYYVYRTVLSEGQTTASGAYMQIGTSVVAQYTDSKCEAGTTYAYKVSAFNDKGESELSDPITATTKTSLYKYDFTGSGSTSKNPVGPTLDGWNEVKDNQLYTTQAGFGFIVAPGNGRTRSTSDTVDAMECDFTLGACTFAVDLPNGDYSIKVYSGDTLTGTSSVKTTFTAEGTLLGTVISPKAGIGTGVYTVRVLDGQLTLEVGGNAYLNGLEITPLNLAPTGLDYYELDLTKSNVYGYFSLRFNPTNDAVSYRIYHKGNTDTDFTLFDSFAAVNINDLHSYKERLGDTYQYYVVGVMADGTETAPSNTVTIDMPGGTNRSALKSAIAAALALVQSDYTADSWAALQTALANAQACPDEADQATVDSLAEALNNAIKALVIEIPSGKLPMETLTDRALVAVALTDENNAGAGAAGGVYLSWRLFKEDPSDITFDIYRNGEKVKSGLAATNWTDADGKAGDEYYVIASSGVGSDPSSPDKVKAWARQYEEFKLVKPADEVMPDNTTCTYTANDASVGDLDGDGRYELVLKWSPSNAQDNSKAGYTGKTFLDAYDFDRNGNISLMWRIDLGVNIRSGAHYTQFQVADVNGDGIAEVACKTADGTTTYSYDNATGQFTETSHVGACGSDALPVNIISAANDYRNTSGYVLTGPEYLTVFNGKTGEIVDTVNYDPPRGDVSSWGDAYGNRVDRFLACTAYLDGVHPSFVFCRGYYTKTYLTAYTMTDGKLTELWQFSSEDPKNIGSYTSDQVEAQGYHNLMVADVDKDGRDEIIYGAICIDHSGKLKYCTGLGHGDAQHIIPNADGGYDVFAVHEHTDAAYGVEIHDANTGAIKWGYYTGKDTGRGLSADIDPTAPGVEAWANQAWNGQDGGLYSSQSTLENSIKLSDNTPSVNFSIYWDGDLLKEMFNHTFNEAQYVPVSTNITKWDYDTNTEKTLFESSEVYTNNGTKGNPCLAADIMGDWRDELILRCSADDSKIRIYTTVIPTNYSIPTLMQDPVYRLAIAWQNTGYNQPADLGYNLTEGLATAQLSTAGVTKNSVSIKWTPASDGIHGHKVQGYYIYRAEGNGNYSLLDTLNIDGSIKDSGSTGHSGIDAEGNYCYTDNTVKSSTAYSYKVAAIVDGQSSFNSRPLKVMTLVSIVSVPDIKLPDLVQSTQAPGGVAALLPAQVDVINSAGETVKADVVWDASDVDIDTPGDYTVTAVVTGWDTPIEVPVKVIPNSIAGYSFADFSDNTIEVVKNTALTLPSTVTLKFLNGATTDAAVSWDISGVDLTKKGTYTINGLVADYGDYKVTMSVKVIDDYIVSIAPAPAIEVDINTPASSIQLPATVSATYKSGAVHDVPVTWDTSNIDNADTGVEGSTVTVKGTVAGFDGEATATLKIVYPAIYKFDFGVNSAQVAEGYTGVTVNPKGGTNTALGAYSPTIGYGFADAGKTTLSTTVEGRNDNTSLAPPDNDYVIGNSNIQFIVDLPNGTYDIYYTSAYWNNGNKVIIKVESGPTSYTTSNGANQAVTGVVKSVAVSDGQLNIGFGSNNYSRLSQIVIRQVQANKTALNRAITAAQALRRKDYTPASWEALQAALTAAMNCPANASQADVDTLTANLNNAIASLVVVPGKEALLDAIEAAKAKDQADYTPASWKAMQEALSAAEACPENASQADVDALTKNLNDAIAALVSVKDLKAAIAKAQALKESDFSAKDWAAIKAAFEAALACPENASQKEVDTLTSDLNAAIAAAAGALYCTVTFDKNGGDNAIRPAAIKVLRNNTIDNLPTTTRAGFVFVGWNTKADGSGLAFTTKTPVTEDITVYAQWSAVNTGGNSGNDSGNSTQPAAQTAPPAAKPVDGKITVPATKDNSGKAAVTLTETQMNAAIDSANPVTARVEIKMDAPAGAKAVEASIPAESLGKAASEGIKEFTVSSPVATITFDSKALGTISEGAKGDVRISAAKADAAVLSAEARKVVGDRPVYNFSVNDGGKTISQFNGDVTITLPYSLKAGEDPNAVVVYYINAEGKPEIIKNCIYNAKTGSITFKTSHFSQYAVGYNKVNFRDVEANAWYGKVVSFIAARGISAGTGNGNFSPKAKLTRGEFLVMAMKAYGIAPDTNPDDNFSDAGDTWYTGYLAAAKRLGLTAGTGDNKYEPQKQITRQEMFTLLYNILKQQDRLPATVTEKTLANFSDSDKIAAWANEAMTFFVKAGVISGSNGRLTPGDLSERAQMAQILYNLLSK